MECAICLEPSFNTTTLPCEHIFCTRCIRRYAKSFASELPCPTCRAPVKINELGLAKRKSKRCSSCELGDFREMAFEPDGEIAAGSVAAAALKLCAWMNAVEALEFSKPFEGDEAEASAKK